MHFWLFCTLALAASLLLTAAVRRYALGRSMLDVPGARSSHRVPTPRGGGIAIVVSYLTCAIWLGLTGQEGDWTWLAISGAGLITALIGFLDDHGHVAARWRLLGHFAAAVWALVWLPELPFAAAFRDAGLVWVLYGACLLFLVWMLNLYNFMDGIDSLASVQAITVCVGMGALYYIGGSARLAGATFLLAACVAGFLYWNFPPAKIFMGDAGSGFLGMVIGILALHAGGTSWAYFCAWLILMGVFIVDATYTLLRRCARGEKIYQAHCSHGYQVAAREHGAHMPVTTAVALINLLWLLPISFVVVRAYVSPVVGVIIAYLPLLCLAVKYRAGAPETNAPRVGP